MSLYFVLVLNLVLIQRHRKEVQKKGRKRQSEVVRCYLKLPSCTINTIYSTGLNNARITGDYDHNSNLARESKLNVI